MRVAPGGFRWTFAIPLVLLLMGTSALGKQRINLTASLQTDCTNCDTDVSNLGQTGHYSLLDDIGPYPNGNGVQSQVLNNNSVYTLDTMNTLVNGVVGTGTRYVLIHFYSTVENFPQFPDDVLPACWQGEHDQNQAVNWSIFSSGLAFPAMAVGSQYGGFARADFNVRNGVCNNQIFRFYLRWYDVCIKRTGSTTCDVTSDSCGATLNYGTAGLNGQGGKKRQTVSYGDWRVPFKVTLSK